MKALHILALLLLALPVVAPAASAVDLTCIEGDRDCPSGMLACVNTSPRACAPDPCATANCFNANVQVVATCWHLAEGGAGQWNSYLCVDPKGPATCAVYTETRAEWGTSRNCVA